MKDLMPDLIISYEHRISMVEELITTVHGVMAVSNESLDKMDREREGLRANLQETLARNCSLRRKDFDRLIDKVLSDSERKREEIDQERKRAREMLKEYLDQQKELAASLRERLIEFSQKKADKSGLEALICSIRAVYQDKGAQAFAALRELQRRLEVFLGEQEEMNHRLQRLVDGGESLRIGDLRQLEAARAREDRRVESELRREGVERLLVHFRQQRQEDSQRKE
jgi:hypothetical protein